MTNQSKGTQSGSNPSVAIWGEDGCLGSQPHKLAPCGNPYCDEWPETPQEQADRLAVEDREEAMTECDCEHPCRFSGNGPCHSEANCSAR